MLILLSFSFEKHLLFAIAKCHKKIPETTFSRDFFLYISSFHISFYYPAHHNCCRCQQQNVNKNICRIPCFGGCGSFHGCYAVCLWSFCSFRRPNFIVVGVILILRDVFILPARGFILPYHFHFVVQRLG